MRHSYRMVQDRLQQSTNILTCRHHMLLALKAKMAKVTYLISQDNSTLTFPTFYLSSNHCNVLLKYEKHIYFLYLNVIYFCRSSHGSMWIQWSSHRLLKIVKSISSKAENCAWFGDCLQTIKFRLGQRVRVSWRFERSSSRHSTLCALAGVHDNCLYEGGGEAKHQVKWFSFLLIFDGIYLLYNVVLVSVVHQRESYIYTHLSPLFWTSFSFRSPQSTEQSSLYYMVGSQQLSVLYIVVYICQSQSSNLSQAHLPFGIRTFVLYICVLISALHKTIYTIFLDSIHVC